MNEKDLEGPLPNPDTSENAPGPLPLGAAVAAVPAFSRSGICLLREKGVLSVDAWREALAFGGYLPDSRTWSDYWRHLLLLCGALFLVSGVIFFIAWNWTGMHKFARLALVEAVVLGSGLMGAYLGPDRFDGRVSLLACGIAVGPMLAVFGQTYQTGAQLWELFRVWTAALVALAAIGRQAALWFAAWIVGNLFVMLWLGRTMDSPIEAIGMLSTLPESVIALVTAFAAWEFAAWKTRGNERFAWLQARWLPRLFFLDITIRLTGYLMKRIFSGHFFFREEYLTLLLPRDPVLALLAVGVAGASWYWHRRRMPDLFMPACILASLASLVAAVLLEMKLFFEAEVWAVFLWGLIIIGLTTGVGAVLQHVQRDMENNGGRVSPWEQVHAFFVRSGPVRTWPELWEFLEHKGLLAKGTPFPADVFPREETSPWYVRVMLAFGGWVAAVLFLAFVALFLFMTMRIRSNEGLVLTFASLAVLAFGVMVLHGRGFFFGHFGLALCLAGAGGVSSGLGLALDFASCWPLPAAVFLALSLAPVRSAAYRFLAAAGAVALAPVGLWGLREHLLPGAGMIALHYAWWAFIAVGFAWCWLRERDWRGNAAWSPAIPPALSGIYAGMAVYAITALSTGFFRAFFWLPLPPLGAACGIALVYLAWKLAGGAARGMLYGALACAVTTIPLGWFLPGVSLAILGLAVGRLLTDRVLQGGAGTFLFAYMVYYYYTLHISLLRKSLLLAATGAILLAGSFLWRRFALAGAERIFQEKPYA